jgi:hypothetical protein
VKKVVAKKSYLVRCLALWRAIRVRILIPETCRMADGEVPAD